jgi:hypothetical protein
MLISELPALAWGPAAFVATGPWPGADPGYFKIKCSRHARISHACRACRDHLISAGNHREAAPLMRHRQAAEPPPRRVCCKLPPRAAPELPPCRPRCAPRCHGAAMRRTELPRCHHALHQAATVLSALCTKLPQCAYSDTVEAWCTCPQHQASSVRSASEPTEVRPVASDPRASRRRSGPSPVIRERADGGQARRERSGSLT